MLNMVWVIIESLSLSWLNAQVKDSVLRDIVVLFWRDYTAIIILMLLNVDNLAIGEIFSLFLLTYVFICSLGFFVYFGLGIPILVL